MAHTGGTWKKGKAFGSIVTDKYEGVEAAYSPETLETYGGYVIAESVSERNMPILLAAPDLLAACEQALSWLTDWHETALGEIPCGCKTCKVTILPLRAAIAKAKGE